MGNASRKSAHKSEFNTTNKSSSNGLPAEILQQAQMETELNLAQLAQLKERKRAELLAFEAQQAKRREEEALLKSKQLVNRDKFLNHIAESQKELEGQIAHVHQQQEISRQKFSEDLYKTEVEMEVSIRNILKDIRTHRDHKQLQELVKAEEAQSQTLLAIKMEEFKNLRKADILDAMKAQLEQEISTQKDSHNKTTLYSTVTMEDEAKNKQIKEILQHRQKDQASLVMQLLEEESWQYEAFKSLLAQRDQRSTQLSQDIRTVVEQLNQLTGWELNRKARQQDITTHALAANRAELAELLAQLLQQQQERRKDLKHLLEEMEVQRQNQETDYWLMQYQRLMEAMPESIQSVGQYRPSAPVLLGNGHNGQCQPSAPSLADTVSPSAPEIYEETTCVICLDSSCQIVFLPCGHLCCCSQCSVTVKQCPMCRSHILHQLSLQP